MPELIENDEKKCPRCAEMVKADARICRFCQYEFASSEPAAPAVLKKRGCLSSLGCLITLLIGIGAAVFMTELTRPGSTLASSPLGVDTQMQGIKNKVADDSVREYNIAVQGGTKMDRCVQAGMVAAAYLQAQDQQKYNEWKETEDNDCRRAGLHK